MEMRFVLKYGGSATTPVLVPKLPPTFPLAEDVIDAIIDDEFVSSNDGGFQRFLVHWKNHPSSDDSWMLEKDLRALVLDLLEDYLLAHSPEASSFQPGRDDRNNKALKVYFRKKYRQGREMEYQEFDS